MRTAAPLQNIATKSLHVSKSSRAGLLLQRKCACGGSASSSLAGECEACKKKRLQKKLSIGASNDPLEQEADRVADQVLSAPAHSVVSATLPRVQRFFTGQATSEAGTAPASVDRVLSGSGRPLGTSLQKDMGNRFGYDFSTVRVHTGSAAEQSARDVNAHAYTVENNIVFGEGQFAPESHAGRKLIAHELAHVIQQGGGVKYACEENQSSFMLAPNQANGLADNSLTTPALQRVTQPTLMRTPVFTSTMDIRHRVLKSRVFHVSEGGIVVTANAGWEASPEWKGAEKPSCGREFYNMSLTSVGALFDSEIATCEFQNGVPVSRTWTGLPRGDYYLTIFTNNTNPNCCLRGSIEVSQQTGLSGSSCGGASDRAIASLSKSEKIAKALLLSAGKMGGEVGERIKELLTPEAIAMMAVFTAAFVVSQTTPIGWVADILVAGLIAATVLMVGREAVEIVKLLIESFETATKATTNAEINKAAELFAKAITKTGVDIIVAILFHRAGKAANLKPPGPRSPGLVEVLIVGGGKIKTTLLDSPAYGDLVTEGGVVVRVPIEKLPNAMMMEGKNAGGSSPKAGGTTTNVPAGKSGATGGKTTKSGSEPGELPGKDTIAGSAIAKEIIPPKEKLPIAEEATKVSEPKKETGAQQEKRLLQEDRASGRPANSATYHSYEGGSRGSFRGWLNSVKKQISVSFKKAPTKPQLNEAPLAEKADAFINRHSNLKAAWEKMNLKIDAQLRDIQSRKSAAAGDKVRIRELERMETSLEKRRTELADFEKGDVGAKRPDLVELFFAERRAIVTDITQRTGDPLHNFKTEFYIELIREVLGWSDVNGVNFNTVYDQNVLP